MASTTFISKVTKITATWLNEVNTLVWGVFKGASSASDARTAINAADKSVTDAHIADTSNPHSVTPAQVGISSFMETVNDDTTAFSATRTLSADYVVSSKSEAAALSVGPLDEGRSIFITSYDGGHFVIEYNSTTGTYADDGGSYCGTQFIPTGGDGTLGFVRKYNGAVNVVWFGATGDGVTDDTDSVANGITFSANNSIPLYFPRGTYLIDQTTILSNVYIIGEGKYLSELKLRTDTGNRLLVGDGVSNVTIKDIGLNTQATLWSTLRTTIDFNSTTSGSNINIIDIYIPGSTSAGIVVDNTTNVFIRKNVINACVDGDGIRVSNGINAHVTDNILMNLDNMANSRRAIQIGSTVDFVCANNYVEDALLTFALDFGTSRNGAIVGNVVKNTLAMVDLEGAASNLVITGNSFNGRNIDDASAYGITIFENPSGSTARKIVITGNTITGLYYGIRCEGGREITITGNSVAEIFAHGISVVDGSASSYVSDNITIQGNTVNNCSKSLAATYDGIAIKADRAVVVGNHVRGVNHRYDINSSSASNTLVQIGMNYAETINRAESYSYNTLSNRRIYEGSADPETFITANPGDIYLRSSGGAGTTLYVKESGTGNTGWVGK